MASSSCVIPRQPLVTRETDGLTVQSRSNGVVSGWIAAGRESDRQAGKTFQGTSTPICRKVHRGTHQKTMSVVRLGEDNPRQRGKKKVAPAKGKENINRGSPEAPEDQQKWLLGRLRTAVSGQAALGNDGPAASPPRVIMPAVPRWSRV